MVLAAEFKLDDSGSSITVTFSPERNAATMRLATLATCSLNQWALDFDGNLERTLESCAVALQKGATYRVGPELELTGYGCEVRSRYCESYCARRPVCVEVPASCSSRPTTLTCWGALPVQDHFFELDTEAHAWESLTAILSSDATDALVVDVGLPVTHAGVRFNCRAFLYRRRVLLLRPKLVLADDGNYREARWFTAWPATRGIESFRLPPCVAAVAGQDTAPIGFAALAFADAVLATELCEELFVPDAPHIQLALSGCEIFSNGSGSHHQLRKLHTRVDLIRGATGQAGGVYLYANQRGCDGGRLYFDGCACVAVNGELVAQGTQFALHDVEVVTATVDLDEVVSRRGAFTSMRQQAANAPRVPLIQVDARLCTASARGLLAPDPAAEVRYHLPEEEIALGPACWLWDYLRRSGAAGYLLPLSGGADSSSTAAIVGSMCQLAVKAATQGDARVAADVARLMGSTPGSPVPDAKALASRVLSTLYMGTANSGEETRSRAGTLASEIGASHLSFDVDSVVAALLAVFVTVTGRTPRFALDGGTTAENLALQNIQARARMVIAFLFAQLLPWVRGQPGFFLVLGSANVDECLRGYMTKYDCSSADVNPIGAVSKADLRRFLRWAAVHLGYPTLASVEAAPPTAELEPRRDGHVQTDEEDMGMSYDELSAFGRLRKMSRCGPLSMFRALRATWATQRGLSAAEVAAKVKRFFYFYAANRHKSTTLTPAYHAESYSPDDNRHDLRPFLYNTKWTRQFTAIDKESSKKE